MGLYTSGLSSSLWESKKKDIAAGVTAIVDDLQLSVLKGATYIFCVTNANVSVMFNMNLINKNNVISETIYGKIGLGISFSVSTSVSLGVVNVNLTNNETASISVELIRYKFN